MEVAPRPTKRELDAAAGGRVADIIAPALDILFCGINPGLYSAAVGHHFARPGNRFWPALHLSGLTPRLLAPNEERDLLALGLGVTNVVRRATASASEITDDELVAGARILQRKVRRFAPRVLAVLGIGAYRTGFVRRSATLGPQRETIGETRVWVLPNPSGINAHYRLEDLVAAFEELRVVAAAPATRSSRRLRG